MLPPPFTHALVLTGPTGSGKTRLGLELAQRLNAEIISMDSMALYRGLDIATAKPTAAERALVPHHLIDALDPWESASVAWWLEQAKACCEDIEHRGKQVLLIGGTPLYLKAIACGLFEGPPADTVVRARLEAEARQHGGAALHQRLAQLDPATASRLHPNDQRRIIRALEVQERTGTPLSAWQTQWTIKPQDERSDSWGSSAQPVPSVLWLDLPRPELYASINHRVENMFAAGLVEEVDRLRALNRPLSKEAAQALGCKEVLAYLEGKQSLAETVTLVQTRTRNFAKRQITWFRRLPNCRPATSQLTWDLWRPKMN
jgi:tRNA dimethylallyltransferase